MALAAGNGVPVLVDRTGTRGENRSSSAGEATTSTASCSVYTWLAWQRPPNTGNATDVRSWKKPDVRKSSLSREGGPLNVTELRLLALTKILAASGGGCDSSACASQEPYAPCALADRPYFS